MSNHKFVVITNGNYFARLILNDLFRHRATDICAVLVVTGDYQARTGLRAVWAIGKNTALPYLAYKISIVLALGLAQRLNRRSCFSVDRLVDTYGTPVKSVVSVNSEEALAWVAAHEPDLLVSVSCPQMIKHRMLAAAKYGGINIHASLLPTNAGLAPYFWVLSNGEETTGTTVHYMTLKFDAGNILVQKKLTISPGESAFHLFARLADLGRIALVEAVEMALSGEPGMEQDMTRYTYFSNPDFSSYMKLRKEGHCLLRFGELLTTIRNEMSHIDRGRLEREQIA